MHAKRLDVSEEKTEPVKAEAPVKAPVEDLSLIHILQGYVQLF